MRAAEPAAETATEEAGPVTVVLQADRQALATIKIGLVVVATAVLTTVISTILKQVEAAAEKAKGAVAEVPAVRAVAQAAAGVPTK
ncbi:hypothetical protein SBDP1_290027 [Syntrophobacter sp. SbD1]|nr:hypothetical protein SBDP1_290027 [Syntrophobacter sp. SbD1]